MWAPAVVRGERIKAGVSLQTGRWGGMNGSSLNSLNSLIQSLTLNHTLEPTLMKTEQPAWLTATKHTFFNHAFSLRADAKWKNLRLHVWGDDRCWGSAVLSGKWETNPPLEPRPMNMITAVLLVKPQGDRAEPAPGRTSQLENAETLWVVCLNLSCCLMEQFVRYSQSLK